MVIEINHINVTYPIGDFRDQGLKEVLIKKIRHQYESKLFQALHDVHFSLERGEMLGIIGENGAGKSTLLKVIAGILPPSEGSVRVEGKLAALLELGSGFDPDLTVRENIYLRGAMLGYTRAFINGMYESIIDFSEINAFQDRPFRTLSSGMKMRIAFSVACLVRPDVLILDEVLAVGDGAFRVKSEEKMREILESNITGLFVSHSLEQVRKVCTKVLWLDHGRQVGFGDCGELCDRYEEHLETRRS